MNKLIQHIPSIIIKVDLIKDKFIFNNAALIAFPHINKMKFSHLVFSGLIEIIKLSTHDKKEILVFERELKYFSRIYNQKIQSIKNEIIIYMTDITEQKEMANQIEDLRNKLNTFSCDRTSKLEKIISHLKRWLKIEKNIIKSITRSLKSSSVGLWTWDIMTDIVFWDETTCGIFGVKKKCLTHPFQKAVNVIHPDDKDRIINEIKMSTLNKEPIETEFKIINGQGSTTVLYTKGQFDLDIYGNPKIMTGVCLDMTKQKNKNRVSYM